MIPASRAKALAMGVSLYLTGLPCKFGHVAPRKAKNGQCVECIKSYNTTRVRTYSTEQIAKRKERVSAPTPEQREQKNRNERIKRIKKQIAKYTEMLKRYEST